MRAGSCRCSDDLCGESRQRRQMRSVAPVRRRGATVSRRLIGGRRNSYVRTIHGCPRPASAAQISCPRTIFSLEKSDGLPPSTVVRRCCHGGGHSFRDLAIRRLMQWRDIRRRAVRVQTFPLKLDAWCFAQTVALHSTRVEKGIRPVRACGALPWVADYRTCLQRRAVAKATRFTQEKASDAASGTVRAWSSKENGHRPAQARRSLGRVRVTSQSYLDCLSMVEASSRVFVDTRPAIAKDGFVDALVARVRDDSFSNSVEPRQSAD